MTVSWAETKDQAIKTALEWWPNAALKGEMSRELPTPTHFEQASQMVTPEMIEAELPCGPDVGPIRDSILEFAKAGFTHVYLHQVGPDQEGFLKFVESELLPTLRPQEVATAR